MDPDPPRRQPNRRETELPAYSPPTPAYYQNRAAAQIHHLLVALTAMVPVPRPRRTFSIESQLGDWEQILSPVVPPTYFTTEPLSFDEALSPVASTSNTTPPPSYEETLKPPLLWLDGGGTKVIIQVYLLGDLLRRLAWDLKYIDALSSGTQAYQIPAKDCFDWVGGGGCGAIIAFAIACGMTMVDLRTKLMEMAPALRDGNSTEVHDSLQKMVPTPLGNMEYEGDTISDSPSRTNVWIPAKSDAMNKPGSWVKKGEPLIRCLLPLVMQEIEKEWRGKAEALDYSVPFLHDVNPIFADCAFLLSLGSGELKEQPPQTWWEWTIGVNKPSPHPPLPVCLPQRRNTIIPIPSYSGPNATFFRLNPSLSIRDASSGRIIRPDDWTLNFSELLGPSASYMQKEETNQAMNRMVTILKRKKIPAPPGFRAPILNQPTPPNVQRQRQQQQQEQRQRQLQRQRLQQYQTQHQVRVPYSPTSPLASPPFTSYAVDISTPQPNPQPSRSLRMADTMLYAPPPPPFMQMNGPQAGPAHPYESSFAQSDTSYAAGPAEVAEILEAKKTAKGKAIERYYE